MATKTITQFTDDLDGSTSDVETVTFSLFGVNYEIELSKGNQSKLESALEPYLNVARKAGAASPTRRGSGSKLATSTYDAKAVRVWAASNNVTVPPRGRIPNAVLEQYQAAGN